MARLGQLLHLLVVASLLAGLPVGAAETNSEDPPPKRVLVVYENESTLFAVREISRGILDTLEQSAPGQFEIYSEYMDAVRFPGAGAIARFREDLIAKYSDLPLDTVITVGPDALQFMLDNREDIAPSAPIVFSAITQSTARDISGVSDVGGVISHFDAEKTIELALRLQPDASRIVVMTGSSNFDRSWQDSARHDLQKFESDLEIDYVSGLTIAGFKDAAARLSKNTILLILTVFEDADGYKFIPRDAAAEIAPASGAPAYAVYSSFLGTGIVGGFMETFESVGRDAANLAIQVMLGGVESPPTVRSTGTPIVDWRQLRRWAIDEALLPPGTRLRYYEPTLWQQYRWEILAILAVVLLQSATIAALIVQDRRRRRIKEELALGRLELARLSRVTQLGELSGALAHEITQPLTSILANAEVGARLMSDDPIDANEVKEIFDDIISDDKRAAAVIAQLRQMMRKGEVDLEVVDLNRAVTGTMALAKSELVARQTSVDVQRDPNELPVRANLAQLQQVILNLVLNAADAMSDLPPPDRSIVVETCTREDGAREVIVSDRGPGIAPEMRDKLFQPFITTKPEGLGLGLAICRTIAQAHGGTLKFDERASRGARIVLSLPAP
jgi:signal transduction histidine kinase